MASASKAWAVVAGVGPGTGYAVARRFSQQYSVALLSRSPSTYEPLVDAIKSSGGHAVGISTDCSDPDSVKNAFEQLRSHIQQSSGNSSGGAPPRLAAAIYNTGGKFVRKPFLELSVDDFTDGYNSSVKGAFLFAQATLPLLLETAKDHQAAGAQGPPTLIFTGATAAIKSSPQLSPFAHASHAKRSLTASLSKEFAPQGVHIAHAIIDGIIDIPRTQAYGTPEWAKKPDGSGAYEDWKISADGIADTYWYLHTQHRSAWTWEVDLRPWVEKW